ncbi:hypothetical protein [Agrobacterium pusense]|uniref:hypothetical protein n=1 Tax=Agrobacterium pusense TaxID=648995 RepID=UPI003FD687D3
MKVSTSTIRSYQTTERLFSTWCKRTGRIAIPASSATVCAFIESLSSRGKKSSTISRHVSGIAWFHKREGFQCPTATADVRSILADARHREDRPRLRKAPLNAEGVAKVVSSIDGKTLAGKRDIAIILLAFCKAMNRSEVVSLNTQDITVIGKDVFLRGEQIPNGAKLKPADTLRTWLNAAAIGGGPLFVRINRGDHLTNIRLTDQAVALIVKRRAKAAGFDVSDISSSSLRAGRIKSALASGKSALSIAKLAGLSERSTLGIAAYARVPTQMGGANDG